MIWGFTLHPGEPCTKAVDKEIHLTMAALDTETDSGVNDVTKKKHCQVMVVTESSELLLLCTLVEGFIYQQNVDIQLKPGERVTFCSQGGRVHLTGYSHISQNIDVNKNDESRIEASNARTDPECESRIEDSNARTCPEYLSEVQTGHERDVIEELFSDQRCTSSASGSSGHKNPDKHRESVPQKKVETRTGKTVPENKASVRLGQLKNDLQQKKLESESGKTPINPGEESVITIKEEPMDISVVACEREVVSAKVKATPKPSISASVMTGDSSQESTSTSKSDISHLSYRSNSPVKCINQALSVTYLPSELESGMVPQSVLEISESHYVENNKKEAEKRRNLYQERKMTLAQTCKTLTSKSENEWRNTISILRDKEYQGTDQSKEKRNKSFSEAENTLDVLRTAGHYHSVSSDITGSKRPRNYEESTGNGQTDLAQTTAHIFSPAIQTAGPENERRTLACMSINQHTHAHDTNERKKGKDLTESVKMPNETECYQYEVRKIISPIEQEIHGEKVSIVSLLGGRNNPIAEGHQKESRPSSLASESCLKRPHPSEPWRTSVILGNKNNPFKKTKETEKEKQGEVLSLPSPSSSTSGARIQSQTSFENSRIAGLLMTSERNLPQVPNPTSSGTTKSNSIKRTKCDCCMKPLEERQTIMLGENRHWFCPDCYTTFASDMELLKYCRIVPQGKHK